MHKRGAFTLIELLVVISVIAALMAILMPALSRARKQARAVACQGYLRQWGLLFSMYMDENNGYFVYGDNDGEWRLALQADQNRKMTFCCPEATNPDKSRGTFGTWGASSCSSDLDADYVGQTDYGSYGVNRWIYNRRAGLAQFYSDDSYWWKGRNVKGANQIPLFLDCSWYGSWALCRDSPPEYDGQTLSSSGTDWADGMRRFCINRHNSTINATFLDVSVRKIGLKELWTMKWHHGYDVNGPWTLAGNVQAEDWPEWMRSCKDY